MITIALHRYHEHIEKLLEDGAYHLARRHCLWILQRHPLHIPTYRLLAKILLEAQYYEEAKDLFQRVLSADPNDYIAHSALSIIYQEEHVTTQALWHLERANEIEPYNAAIRQELRVLYLEYLKEKSNGRSSQIDLSPNATFPLSDGGLARLYVRSELYQQAVKLLRAALAKDENRYDLRVVLLEALWRDGHRMEAVKVGLQVLEELPNCIVANAILADIWLRTGRMDEAQSYLRRVQALLLLDATQLESDSPISCAFRADGALTLPDELLVEYMGKDDPGEEDADTPILGAAATADEELNDWLEGLAGSRVPAAAILAETAERSESDELDWLEEDNAAGTAAAVLHSRPEEPAHDEATTAVAASATDWLAELDVPDEETAVDQPESTLPTGTTEDLEWLEQAFVVSKSDRIEPVLGQLDETELELPDDWLVELTEDELDILTQNERLPDDFLVASAASNVLADGDRNGDTGDDFESLAWLDSLTKERLEDVDAEAGEIDLSQFLALPVVDKEETEETFEWRLTDELTPPDEPSDSQADIPDWLMGSIQIEELDDDHASLEAQLTEEFADWVANQNMGPVEEPHTPVWLAETAVDDTNLEGFDDLEDLDDPDDDSLAAYLLDSAEPQSEPEPLQTGELPDWLLGDALDRPDSESLSPDSAADFLATGSMSSMTEADAGQRSGEERLTWTDAEVSAAQDEFSDQWLPEEPDDLLIKLFAEADAHVEEVVSDDKEEKPTGPQEEGEVPQEYPEMDQSLDWLEELGDLSLSDMGESIQAEETDELADWLQTELGETDPLAELADALGFSDSDAPSDAALPLGETAVDEADLDWLDALAAGKTEGEPIDETPTWQWPPDSDDTADEPPTPHLLADDEVADEAAQISFAAASLESADDYPDDLDDAMSWLEKLAGEPDAPVEELPSIAARLDKEDFPETTDWAALSAADEVLSQEKDREPAEENRLEDAVPAGLAGLAGAAVLHVLSDEPSDADEGAEAAGEELPHAVEQRGSELAELAGLTVAAGLMDDELDEFDLNVPDDPDEAMAWLEQLAARQGAPLDELPSMSTEDALEEAFDEVASEEPDWFEEDESEASFDALMTEALAEEDLPTLVDTADASLEALDDFDLSVPDDPDEAMAWLEQLAARQGAPLEELPSLDQASSLTETAVLAAALDMPEDEDTWDSEEDLADLLVLDGVDEAAESLPDTAPDDLAEAMVWLEQLAARQDEQQIDELSAVSDAIPESLFAEGDQAELDIFDDDWVELVEVEEPAQPTTALVNEALLSELDWLAEVSGAADEAGLDDLADLDVDDEALAAALDSLEDLARQTSHLPSETFLGESEDVLAEAWETGLEPETISDVSWAIEPTEEAIAEIAEPPAEPEPSVADEVALEAATYDDIPDDPEEAMAWLERLAARQGVSADELPSVDEDEAARLRQAGLAALVVKEIQEAGEEEETAAEADVTLEERETAEAGEAIFAELGLDTLSSEELHREFDVIDDSLPDWLVVEQETASVRVTGDTDWLDALPEPDLEGWLAAEEEATAKGPTTDVPSDSVSALLARRVTGDTGPLSDKDLGSLIDPSATLPVETDDLVADWDFALPTAELDRSKLSSAQEALATGEFETALSEFTDLVETGHGLNTVIANLEVVAEQHDDRPLLRRLLGDAYMRNGQLQKALDTYRQALDQL